MWTHFFHPALHEIRDARYVEPKVTVSSGLAWWSKERTLPG